MGMVRRGGSRSSPASLLFILGLVIFLVPRLTLALVIQFVGLFWLIDGVVGLACIFADRSNWGWKLRGRHPRRHRRALRHPTPAVGHRVRPARVQHHHRRRRYPDRPVQLVLVSCGSGWRTGIPGVVSIAIGLLLAFIPMLGAALLPLALGGLALVGGIGTIFASFRRRSAERRRRAYARDRTTTRPALTTHPVTSSD